MGAGEVTGIHSCHGTPTDQFGRDVGRLLLQAAALGLPGGLPLHLLRLAPLSLRGGQLSGRLQLSEPLSSRLSRQPGRRQLLRSGGVTSPGRRRSSAHLRHQYIHRRT